MRSVCGVYSGHACRVARTVYISALLHFVCRLLCVQVTQRDSCLLVAAR